MTEYVYILFSDGTWFFAPRDETLPNWLKLHRWKNSEIPKNAIILPAKPRITYSLEDDNE